MLLMKRISFQDEPLNTSIIENDNSRLGGLEGVDANGQKRSFHLSDYKYAQFNICLSFGHLDFV